MSNDIEKRVKKIVSNYTRFNIHIRLSTRLREDLGMDSVNLLEFINELEDEFQFDITDGETSSMNFGTVNRVIIFIKNKKNKIS